MPSLCRLLPLVVALALPAGASAATVVVNPGDDVDAKVDSANPGDTVLFKAGGHTGRATVDDATITLAGEPGAILVNPSTGTGPTVTFNASAGAVTDLVVASSAGTAIQFSGGGSARVLRSTVVSTAANGIAVTTIAGVADANATRTLTVDSSVLVGKTALSASYSAAALLSSMTVNARHVTAIGNLSSDNSLSPASPITFTVLDSIVRGTRTNVPVSETRNSIAANASDAASLFVRPASFNYHLRADAPVIDKGQITTGESETDVDGQARTAGSASDYGADEFHNRAPTAKLAGPSGAVRQGMAVTFSAEGSTDPESAIGGGIVRYLWDFGDGTTETTTTPTVSHTFAGRQAYNVTVRVTDRQGATSEPAGVSVTALDGTAPTVTIVQPSVKQRIDLYRRGTQRRQRVVFFGTAADDTALGSVLLALRPVASRNGQCRWYDGKRRLTTADCTVPVILTAKLTGGQWRYTLPRAAKLPRGPYQLYAVAVDASGLASAVQTVAFRFR